MLVPRSLPKPSASSALPAFYRLKEVTRITALSRSTVYRRIAEGRFPEPVHLGGRASAWPSAALQPGSTTRRGIGGLGRNHRNPLRF